MKEMVGGCCVCSDERGWPENPLVYCDGQGCTVAVHQACYGIVTVPLGPWYCRKCESQERAARVRCDLCPSRDGALKKTDSPGGGWAHVVCALYIPEVRFGNVTTMEPIILQLIPQERYNKTCYICQENGKGSRASMGACMQCNKSGCKQQFHVTCAQQLGLLCEEAGNYLDNVKYCGYCQYHYSKLKKGGNVKPIPPYKPISHDAHSSDAPSSPEKDSEKGKSTDPQLNNAKQRKSSSTSKISSSTLGGSQMSGGASGQSSSVLSTATAGSGGGLLSSNSLASATFGGSSSSGGGSASTSGTGKGSSSSSSSTKDAKESKHKGAGKSTTKGHDKEPTPSIGGSRTYKLKNKEYDPSQSNTSSSSGSSHSKNDTKDGAPQKTSSANPIVQPARLTAVSPSLGLAPSSLGGLTKQESQKVDQKSMDVFTPKFTTSNFTEIMVNEQSGSSSGSGGGGSKKRKSDGRLSSGSIVDDSNKDLIRDVSVTLVPLQGYDKIDSSDAEKSIKKFCISQPKSESPAITTATSTVVAPVDVNLQNLSPNIVSSKQQQQQQVIQQNVQSSSVTSQQQSNNGGSSSSSKSVTSQPQQTTTQSLVVSVPLSTANVPGVNLNLAHNNNNNNISNNNNNLTSSGGQNVNPFIRNEQMNPSQNRQQSPAINHHNQILDREPVQHRTASPSVLISPIDHGGGNIMHSSSMADIQGGSTMLKITYEKQNRVGTLQEERSARRSRTPEVIYSSSSSGGGNFGGLKFGYEAQTPAATSSTSSSITNPLQIIATQATIKDSPQSSPGSEGGNSKKRIKKQHTSTSSTSASTPTDGSSNNNNNGGKLFQNGISHAAHMLGNTLNPASSMAAKMTDTLNQEIEAHMANTVPESVQHVGPMYPGKIQANRPSALATHGSQSLSSMLTGNPTVAGSTPQSLEQLLERQWEQGSQFLMEQAQHFDIASLLSCLHQLKSENVRLEEHVTSLVARRDHLLAVNARLAIPLNPPAGNQGHYNNMHSTTNGPVQSENAANAAAAAVNSASGGSSVVNSSRRGSSQVPPQQSSYNSGGGHAQQQQQQQQQLPLENGIDFRHSSNSGSVPSAHSGQMSRHSTSSSQSYSSNSRQSSSSGRSSSAAAAFISQQQVYSSHQSMRRDDGGVKPS